MKLFIFSFLLFSKSLFESLLFFDSTLLSGASDVIVSQDKDGIFRSTEFCVVFGKVAYLLDKMKQVDLCVFQTINQQIVLMNLQKGINKLTFKLNLLWKSYELNARIFLWDYDSKIVISDIDGTITKSDASDVEVKFYQELE